MLSLKKDQNVDNIPEHHVLVVERIDRSEATPKVVCWNPRGYEQYLKISVPMDDLDEILDGLEVVD